jgi:hypothetical protein
VSIRLDGLYWRGSDGRRWRSIHYEDESPSGREYAPKGIDGEPVEGREWPFEGSFYCNTYVDTPASRWYRLECLRPGDADYGPWYSWERCDPPKGYVGAPKTEEFLESPPLPAYDDEAEDTTPGVTI